MVKMILATVASILLLAGGIYMLMENSNKKPHEVFEKFARDLGEGKLEEAYAMLHPNAKRGIPFSQFKAAFGRMQPVVTVSIDKGSTIDKLSGKTVSNEGCESKYIMKVVDYMGDMAITQFNFTPYCGY